MTEDITPWRKVKTSYLEEKHETSNTSWMEVPGGRLYKHWISHQTGCSVSLAFVPADKDAEALRKEVERLMEENEKLRSERGSRDDLYG